jgi:hypothetical protein
MVSSDTSWPLRIQVLVRLYKGFGNSIPTTTRCSKCTLSVNKQQRSKRFRKIFSCWRHGTTTEWHVTMSRSKNKDATTTNLWSKRCQVAGSARPLKHVEYIDVNRCEYIQEQQTDTYIRDSLIIPNNMSILTEYRHTWGGGGEGGEGGECLAYAGTKTDDTITDRGGGGGEGEGWWAYAGTKTDDTITEVSSSLSKAPPAFLLWNDKRWKAMK